MKVKHNNMNKIKYTFKPKLYHTPITSFLFVICMLINKKYYNASMLKTFYKQIYKYNKLYIILQ